MNHAEIRYAGSNAINTNGSLHISNSTISNSKGNGINLNTRATNVSIENNNIVENGGTGVYINYINDGEFSFNKNTISNSGKESISINLTGYKPTNEASIFQNNSIDGRIRIFGTIQQDFTFNKNVYNLVGELVIPTGKTLTIEAGAIINHTVGMVSA